MAANNNSHPSTTTVSSSDDSSAAAFASRDAVRPRQTLGVTVCEKKTLNRKNVDGTLISILL